MAAAEAAPSTSTSRSWLKEFNRRFMAGPRAGNKGTGKGEAQAEAPKIRTFFCPGVIGSPQGRNRVLVESTGLGADKCREGSHLAAAYGAAEGECVEILEGRARFDPNLLDPFIGVIDSSCNVRNSGSVGRFPARLTAGSCFGGFDRLDGLFVAHRCVAGRIDSIDDNSRR